MVVKKKTAAKPAAKKTTAAKPAAKKATAAKSTAKKTTKAAAKPAAKKATKPAAKSAVKKIILRQDAEGISVTGNKKVETLLKEFNNRYPFIRLCICDMAQKENREKGGNITLVPLDKNLSEVRTRVNPGSITITGNKKVKTLEKEFEDVFGLYVEVSFTTGLGNRYYTRGKKDKTMKGETPLARVNGDNMTLNGLNEECEKEGCKKGEWY